MLCITYKYAAPVIQNINSCTVAEVIDNVKKGTEPPYRPEIPKSITSPDSDNIDLVKQLMIRCWEEQPEDRPESFSAVKHELRKINKGKSVFGALCVHKCFSEIIKFWCYI